MSGAGVDIAAWRWRVFLRPNAPVPVGPALGASGGCSMMSAVKVARTIAEAREHVAAARVAGRLVHFVPTMGALHEGHFSLVRAAKGKQPFVVVSIFVNPTQFSPGEDFARYPRPVEADLAKCGDAGVDLVFLPSAAQMYPPGSCTTVRVAGLTEPLCGAHRPGHFDGVTTVVAKLLNIVQPDVVYFGQKDAQQVTVVRRMIADLDIPVRIIVCPTVREPDGLAMSSRNAYLSEGQRRQARYLVEALRLGENLIRRGECDTSQVLAAMRAHIVAAGPCSIDYVEAVDSETLQPLTVIDRPVLLALAVRIGSTRLIDNLHVE